MFQKRNALEACLWNVHEACGFSKSCGFSCSLSYILFSYKYIFTQWKLEGGGVGEPPTKFKKGGGGLTGPQFLEGYWERGG